MQMIFVEELINILNRGWSRARVDINQKVDDFSINQKVSLVYK